MVKLQWLQINRFRSVKPETRLTFNPGYNVLLGQNGTGKTTLLNLVAAVVKSNFWALRDTPFDLKYSLSSSNSTATISVRNEPRASGLQRRWTVMRAGERLPRPTTPPQWDFPEFEAGHAEPLFTTEVTIESKTFGTMLIETQGSTGTVRVMGGDTWDPPVGFESGINEDLWWKIAVAIAGVRDKYPLLSELLADLFSEQQLLRFDESLEYFTHLSDMEVELVRSQGALHAYAAYTERIAPLELQNALKVLAQAQWGSDRYVITHAQLPFLRAVVQLLDFESAEATIDLQESAHSESGDWMKLSKLGFFFTHRGGWKISAKLLSYGQKRMLAFLCYLATVQSVAVADELVNGLHHRWIQAAIEALGQRQVFVTSQNPLLLDYLTFENPEQVRSTFILCRWEGEGAQAQMLWENMTLEAAEDFFDSYKVGFQQVGELLQAKGLW